MKHNSLPSSQSQHRTHLHNQNKQQQQKQMDTRHIERKNNDYQLSIKSSEDDNMKMALTKVRKSNVTHNEDLLRRQGTWMWNMK